MQGMKPYMIHCLGDSITEAGGLPECGRWTGLLQRMVEAEGFDGVEVYNHGVGGNTTAMGLERMRNEKIGADLTLIEFGLNDCSCSGYNVKNRVSLDEYDANLRAMVAIVHRRGGQAALLANHLPVYKDEKRQGDGALYSDKIRIYNRRVREIAAEDSLPLLDMEAVFAAPELQHRRLRADGLHLNPEGNRVYAEHVLAFVRPFMTAASMTPLQCLGN